MIASPLTDDESDWAVCDTSRNTRIDDDRDGSGRWRRPARPEAERSRHTAVGSAVPTYLLYDGWRAQSRPARRRRGAGIAARRRCAAAGFACAARCHTGSAGDHAPHIPGAGSPGPRSLAGFTVGTVVRITRAAAAEHYVVLADGVQRIGEVAADLIRMAVSHSDREIATVAPDAIGASPTVNVLPVGTFPPRGAPIGAAAIRCCVPAGSQAGHRIPTPRCWWATRYRSTAVTRLRRLPRPMGTGPISTLSTFLPVAARTSVGRHHR